MRNSIKLSGLAILAMLAAAGGVSAQTTTIQPQYQPGAGSSFIYQPGPMSGPNQAARSVGSQGTTQGPVTGYGAGGLVRAPGTAQNPPYFRGSMGARGR
jgi:hypothetical protein